MTPDAGRRRFPPNTWCWLTLSATVRLPTGRMGAHALINGIAEIQHTLIKKEKLYDS